jgi:hypothetical protein
MLTPSQILSMALGFHYARQEMRIAHQLSSETDQSMHLGASFLVPDHSRLGQGFDEAIGRVNRKNGMRVAGYQTTR